jgi:hypothetical protein
MTYGSSMDYIGHGSPAVSNRMKREIMALREYLHKRIFLVEDIVLSFGWIMWVQFGYSAEMDMTQVK